jgi:hypothetical protein
MYRSAPKMPSSFTVSVQLPDSVSSERLAGCIILVDTSNNSAGTSVNINAKTAFRCLTPADTAGKNLVPFGVITIRSRPDSFPFLLPRAVVENMRSEGRKAADSIAISPNLGDSIRAAVDSAVDSAVRRAR